MIFRERDVLHQPNTGDLDDPTDSSEGHVHPCPSQRLHDKIQKEFPPGVSMGQEEFQGELPDAFNPQVSRT